MRSGNPDPVVIIGGGPAGLTAAYELVKRGVRPLVLEKGERVGGIARTEEYKGYRFDIGGHRFFTKVPEVANLWREVLGPDFIKVPRMSRIHYRGKYYAYPLQLRNTLENLGLYESARIMLSYVKWRMRPHRREETFEEWVVNRFGGRLYWHFFRTYTEKVWGIPCTKIRADWAAQRIKDLSLRKAVVNALTGANDTTSLITAFDYPVLGPGMMWERFRDRVVDHGGEVRMRTNTVRILRSGNTVTGVVTRDENGDEQTVATGSVISSMPMTELILNMDPPPPDDVVAAARALSYRDFLIVALIVRGEDLFPDNWIYIHSPEVQVGRIQNFRSWSAAMVPDPTTASIGMEYFCHEGDGLWAMPDDELIALAKRELAHLGLASSERVVDGTVIRQEKAYPLYDEDYRRHVDTIRGFVESMTNLQTVGRNGMHRYNNQDHSMLTAMLAVRNLMGEKHDLWNVNVERSYHEEFVTREEREAARAGEAPTVEVVSAASRRVAAAAADPVS